MNLTLRRQKVTEVCTLGRLYAEDGAELCVTLEEPWRDANQDGLGDTNVSRIPAGTYPAFRRMSPARGYEVFELRDVPGRSNVQIHKGNNVSHTLGCILVGTAWADDAITGSRLAFDKLMHELRDVSEFSLIVVDVPHAGDAIAQ